MYAWYIYTHIYLWILYTDNPSLPQNYMQQKKSLNPGKRSFASQMSNETLPTLTITSKNISAFKKNSNSASTNKLGNDQFSKIGCNAKVLFQTK